MGVNFPYATGPYKDRKRSTKTPFSAKISTTLKKAINEQTLGDKKMRNDFGSRNMEACPAKDGYKKGGMKKAKGGMMKPKGGMKTAKASKASKNRRSIAK